MGLSMWAEFADGHVEEIEDRPSLDELTEHALATIRRLEVDHGECVRLQPASGRFEAVSPERAAALRAEGFKVVNTRGMSYQEAMQAIGLDVLHCPVHVGVPEPCPTCSAYMATGL